MTFGEAWCQDNHVQEKSACPQSQRDREFRGALVLIKSDRPLALRQVEIDTVPNAIGA